MKDADFDESEHKRDEKGRFAEKESSKENENFVKKFFENLLINTNNRPSE